MSKSLRAWRFDADEQRMLERPPQVHVDFGMHAPMLRPGVEDPYTAEPIPPEVLARSVPVASAWAPPPPRFSRAPQPPTVGETLAEPGVDDEYREALAIWKKQTRDTADKRFMTAVADLPDIFRP